MNTQSYLMVFLNKIIIIIIIIIIKSNLMVN